MLASALVTVIPLVVPAAKVIATLLACQAVIVVHSFGHVVVGRWSGIRAEVLCLGFGPVLASRVDRHGTRWQLAFLPFGTRLEFHVDQERGAPIPARAVTALAGPAFNLALSLALFVTLFMLRGMAKDPDDIAGLLALGLEFGLDELRLTIRALLSVLHDTAFGATSICGLPGPISIGKAYVLAASESWITFVLVIAYLSTAFGVFNLLPAPGLDGGDLAFLAWEAMTGRPPGHELKDFMVACGLALILVLLLLAIGFDIFCP